MAILTSAAGPASARFAPWRPNCWATAKPRRVCVRCAKRRWQTIAARSSSAPFPRYRCRRQASSQQFAQFRVARTADGQLSLVVENGNAAVLFGQLYFCQPRYIENEAAMDTQESPCRQLPLEFAKSLFLEIASSRRPDRYIVVLRFDIVDLIDRDHMHMGAVPYEQAIDCSALTMGLEQLSRRNRLALGDAQPRQLQRFGEALRPKRLEQIIDGMHLERTQCVIVVGCREHDACGIAADEIQHFESVQLRHLDIQEQQIRFQFVGGLHRFQAVGAFGYDT